MLSGWGFAAESLSPIGKCCSGDEASGLFTPVETIHRYFRESGVRIFACTHTCLPHARDYEVDGAKRLIINNGAAGMPNFANTTYGLITRISAIPEIPGDSLYGIELAGLRVDAIPVPYDQPSWLQKFQNIWQPGSPAFENYSDRIVDGPDFTLREAIGGAVRLA